MMCFTLEIHGWIYHINPRQRLEKKKIKKKENKKRKPPLEWVSHKVQPVSSRVQGEHSLGDGAIMDIKSSFKQCQPFVTLESELGIVLSVGWIWEVLKYHLFKLTQPWNLTYNFPSHLISLVFFSCIFLFLSQESLPHSGPVLGWLFVCQHECVYCRDSGRWAASSIRFLSVPRWQALIRQTSALPCTISVTVQPAN